MHERILEFLHKKQEYVSGEDLSRSLDISRQALWKHIQDMRESGYEIVAVPHLGYKLVSSPDRLFPSEVKRGLNTKFVGRKVYYAEKLASTMDSAVELGLHNEPEGTIVIAESQTKGRGRLGRNWESPKYKGIYVSVILRPDIKPNQAPLLNLIAAVAICEAIKTATGLLAQIKWPNDILIKNKKLAGILTELHGELDAVNFVVLGIGLNVNSSKEELVTGASSLKEENKAFVDRVELLKEVLRRIEDNYCLFRKNGSKEILDRWKSFNVTLGRKVRIICNNNAIDAESVDIDVDGGLLVRRDSGVMEKFMAADIVHLR